MTSQAQGTSPLRHVAWVPGPKLTLRPPPDIVTKSVESAEVRRAGGLVSDETLLGRAVDGQTRV